MFFHKSSITLPATENMGDKGLPVRALQLSLGFSSKMHIPIMANFEANGFWILQEDVTKRFSELGLPFSPPAALMLSVDPESRSYSYLVVSRECNCLYSCVAKTTVTAATGPMMRASCPWLWDTSSSKRGHIVF